MTTESTIEGTEVRAAGGILMRRDDAKGKILVAHRPRYDDWTFPKGKTEAGETWQETALREVLEETGFQCSIEHLVGGVSYRDRHERLKEVRYYLMLVDAGSFETNEEVDSIKWIRPAKALKLLTYGRDRDLLADNLERLNIP